MSTQITTAMVEQYKANLQILQQQAESRLRGVCRVESVVGKNAFFDQLGSTAAVLLTNRHADTPLIDTPHLRRRVTLLDYGWADLIDELDNPKLLIDPQSSYAINARNAMNRAIDDAIISAASGTAYGGVAGGTTYTFDTTYKRVAHASAGLTLAKILSVKQMMDTDEIPDEGRCMVIGSKGLSDLLAETQVGSADYNTVKALVTGDINTFLGFKFIRSERLTLASNVRTNLAWQRDSMLLALGADVKVDIGERRDKNMATQVYVRMSIGAVRMDEDGVVELQSYEA
jgi:hypothetical protein